MLSFGVVVVVVFRCLFSFLQVFIMYKTESLKKKKKIIVSQQRFFEKKKNKIKFFFYYICTRKHARVRV